MKYLIAQDWPSTSGNHAGMRHMCEMLKSFYPADYEVIVKEKPNSIPAYDYFVVDKFCLVFNRLFRGIRNVDTRYRQICREMFYNLKDGDEVFLLEYMYSYVSQLGLAKYIRKNYPNVKIYALCHLTPTVYEDKTIYPQLIKEWAHYVDKLLTLGSSLSAYFIENGIEANRVSTGSHYVDHYYYQPQCIQPIGKMMKVIVMGAMQRNYKLVSEVCRLTPNVEWTICKGRAKIDNLFGGLKNVILKGFLSEDELRTEMANADVSMNVMDDTIGSNVITTSLAMGLAMVCSDVGSIRDYCDERNTIFCDNTPKALASAINKLDADHTIVLNMKQSSFDSSFRLHIDKINAWFCSLNT